VEPANDHCNSEGELSCGEKPCKSAACICGTEAEKCEERSESTNKEDGMQNGRLFSLERWDAAEICGNEWEDTWREEAECASEDGREQADLIQWSHAPLYIREKRLDA
jgi:hypothetical protein